LPFRRPRGSWNSGSAPKIAILGHCFVRLIRARPVWAFIGPPNDAHRIIVSCTSKLFVQPGRLSGSSEQLGLLMQRLRRIAACPAPFVFLPAVHRACVPADPSHVVVSDDSF